jgi:tRNA U34 5-methylaminomethyl-2-thiouridine-forming methyltransferase MnmC
MSSQDIASRGTDIPVRPCSASNESDSCGDSDTLGQEFTFASGIDLKLITGNATAIKISENAFDVVFQDPFSPEVNPELWSAEFLARLLRTLRPGGTLATYCVKSGIQQTLREVGFEVSRHRGPRGGKREVLVAVRPAPSQGP